jgi:hypothetical protein
VQANKRACDAPCMRLGDSHPFPKLRAPAATTKKQFYASTKRYKRLSVCYPGYSSTWMPVNCSHGTGTRRSVHRCDVTSS